MNSICSSPEGMGDFHSGTMCVRSPICMNENEIYVSLNFPGRIFNWIRKAAQNRNIGMVPDGYMVKGRRPYMYLLLFLFVDAYLPSAYYIWTLPNRWWRQRRTVGSLAIKLKPRLIYASSSWALPVVSQKLHTEVQLHHWVRMTKLCIDCAHWKLL